MIQCDGAKEQWLTCAVITKMEPRCQQGRSGLLLSGRVISPAQRPLPHNTQHSQETDIHAPGGIQTRNPSKQPAADRGLRPRRHWDRHRSSVFTKIILTLIVLMWRIG